MRTTIPTIISLILVAVLPAGEPATEPTRVLLIGGYQTAQDNMPDMVAALLQHGGYGANVQAGFVSSDAHATPTSNHAAQLIEWVRGRGVGEGRKKKLADAGFATGPLAAAVMELNPHGLKKHPETDLAAVQDFAAACKERGIPGVLFLLANTRTHGGNRRKPETVKPMTLEAYRAEVEKIDALYAKILAETDLAVAPAHRVMLALRERHPDIDLHPPRDGTDGHHSPRDHYLAACTIAAVLLGKRPESPPDPAVVMRVCQDKLGRDNAKRKRKGQPEVPWHPLTEEENRAIQDVVWATVAAGGKDAP